MPQNENPADRPGSNGVVELGKIFRTEEYRTRAVAATALSAAIAACHPHDACKLMAAALESLSDGPPLAIFINALGQARWWAASANSIELKAYVLAAFEAMPPKGQATFLRFVQGGAT